MHHDLTPFHFTTTWLDLPLEELLTRAGPTIHEIVAGALIQNPSGKIFAQKRSATRKLFPGCWDIAGGHVEEGETLRGALAREIREETGWELIRVIEPIMIFDWTTDSSGVKRCKREFDFIVEVSGALTNPRLEADKCSEFRWFGLDDAETLKENRKPGDTVIYDMIVAALKRTPNKGSNAI